MQEDGELVGFDIDLLEAVVDETEYELGEWATFEFDSLIPALTQNEEIDVIAAAMTITEDRQETIAFSDPYWESDQAILVREGGDFQPSAWEDFGGVSVGAQSGTTGADQVQSNLVDPGLVAEDDYRTYGSYVLAVEDLENENIDAVVIDLPVAGDVRGQPRRRNRVYRRDRRAVRVRPPAGRVGVPVGAERRARDRPRRRDVQRDHEHLVRTGVGCRTRRRSRSRRSTARRRGSAVGRAGPAAHRLRLAARRRGRGLGVRLQQRRLPRRRRPVDDWAHGRIDTPRVRRWLSGRRGRGVRRRPLKRVVSAAGIVLRGTPIVVILIVMYFVVGVPQINLGVASISSAMTAGILGLGLRSAAYQSQIFRATLSSVDDGQLEAGRSIGLSRFEAVRYVVVPQALRRSIPGFQNEFTIVLKDTSIVFAIGLAELLTRGYDLFSEQTTAVLEVILFISAIYFVLTFTTNRALDRLGDYYAIPEGSRRE